MNDFRTQLGAQLVAAQQEQIAAAQADTKPRRRWSMPRVIGAILIGTAVVGAPAAALTGVWDPDIGDGTRPAPEANTAPPARAVSDHLSVLQRTQTDADRAGARYALRFITKGVAGVHTGAIRTLRPATADRGPIVLIPVDEYDIDDGKVIRAPGLGPISSKKNGLCTFAEDRGAGDADGGGWLCFSTRQIRTGHAAGSLGGTVFTLAPDGVDHATITYANGVAITAAVAANLYTYERPEDASGATETVSWFDSQGRKLLSRKLPVTRAPKDYTYLSNAVDCGDGRIVRPRASETYSQTCARSNAERVVVTGDAAP